MLYEVITTVNFKDSGKTFFLYKDIKKLATQFADIEPQFEQKMMRYLKKCEQVYNDTVNLVIKQNFDSLQAYLITLARVNPVITSYSIHYTKLYDRRCRNASAS